MTVVADIMKSMMANKSLLAIYTLRYSNLTHPWIPSRDCWGRSKSEGDKQEVIGSQLMLRVMYALTRMRYGIWEQLF